MKTSFFSLVFIISTSIFSQTNEVKTYYDSGDLKSTETHVNNTANGPFKTYYETGELAEVGTFKTRVVEGKPLKLKTGSYKGMLPNGIIVFEGTFAIINNKQKEVGLWKKVMYYDLETRESEIIELDGKYHGEIKKYYRNGQLKEIGTFEKGVRKGMHFTYFENGRIKSSQEHFSENHLNTEKEFYEDGTLKKIGNFRNNILEGIQEEYFKNGKVKKKMESFSSGNLNWIIEEFNANGKIIQQEKSFRIKPISSEKKYGLIQWEYHVDGTISNIKKTLSKFEETGIIEKYSIGLMYESTEIVNGVFHGEQKDYLTDGRVIRTKIFSDGEFISESLSKYQIIIKNKCRKDIYVTINYKNLDNDWETDGAFVIKMDEEFILGETKNDHFFYIAQTKNGKKNWRGDYFKTFNGQRIGFRKKDLSDKEFGAVYTNLTCDK